MSDELSPSITAVRWLESGRDVLIRCDDGFQGSALLRQVAGVAEAQGFVTRQLDLDDMGNGTAGATPRAAQRPGRAERDIDVPRPGGRAVVLVEDLSEFSPGAVEQLSRTLRRGHALLVATTALDLVRHGDPHLGRLVASRGPAEIRVPAMGYSEMMAHVEERLGGPVEARLVSSLLAQSAGLPSVAAAVLDAGRVADVIRLEDGVWSLTGDVSAIPLDPVAHLLCARLSASDVSGLVALSVMGPASPSELSDLIPPEALERLVRRHRVIAHGRPPHTVMSVSPPALAAALRSRAVESDTEGLDLGAGAAGDRIGGPPDLLGLLLSPDAEHRGEFRRRALEIMTMVQDVSHRQEVEARDRWRRSRSVEDAVDYLGILLQRPTRELAREVFSSTREHGDAGLTERFRLLQVRWIKWLGEDTPEWEDFAAQNQDDDGPIERVNAIVRAVLASAPTPQGDADLASVIPLSAAAEEPTRSLGYVLEATALHESGRFDLALRLSDPALRPEWVLGDMCTFLDGVYHKVLLALGRVHESFSASRERLAQALDDLDQTGIRVYAVGLAQSLVAMGMNEAAGSLVFAVLRLGPAGPVGSGFYQHLLILAAAHTMNDESAGASRLLAEELERLPVTHLRTVDAPREMARAHLSRLDARDEEADDLIWSEGERLAREGRLHNALVVWSQLSAIPSPRQIEAIRAVADVRPAPLMARIVAVQEALAGGDLAAVTDAARDAPLSVSPPLAAAVLDFVDGERRKRGEAPLGERERADLVGEDLSQWLATLTHHRRTTVLSGREKEIVRLVAEGRSNQEVATLLGVSRRTIENHVHRSLKKLRLAGRDDFRSVQL
ncbi:helix-turn-helix transcriptional regulator [Propionicicella superfundia]|uniref:helix-turn-helix transcriptional regulator n=1 Tax=Propionicicella superfundia TaxID=348582 RepID=UPI00040832B2|nr:LuxR family transcriptional regulator [Propionicicella superfundia]